MENCGAFCRIQCWMLKTELSTKLHRPWYWTYNIGLSRIPSRITSTKWFTLLYYTITCLYVCFIEGCRKVLIAPVFMRIVLHSAAVWLHLLIQTAAVDQHRLTALGVPSALSEHLLQLLDGVAALPLPDAVLLHPAVAPSQCLRRTRKPN